MKSKATIFKESVESLVSEHPDVTVYEILGALEVVKCNLLERLGRCRFRHVVPVGDIELHSHSRNCWCHPLEIAPNLYAHNAKDCREKYERQDGKERGGWETVASEE